MVNDDLARLERVLSCRRGEEELARHREARALRAVETAGRDVRRIRAQVRTCREGVGSEAGGGGGLIDAHHCATRLGGLMMRRRAELEAAREGLAEAREALAEAGRRRLAVERMAATRALRLREAERTAEQGELDESGRLHLLREGD